MLLRAISPSGEPTDVHGYGTGRGGAGQDPARVREAQWLVQNRIYPDLATAYQATRTRVGMDPSQVRANALRWITAQKDRYGRPKHTTPEQTNAAFVAYQKWVAGDTEGALVALKALEPQPKVPQPGWVERTVKSLFGSSKAPQTPAPAVPGGAPQAGLQLTPGTALDMPPGTTTEPPGDPTRQRIQQAHDAINRGADPNAVRERLQNMGIDPRLLDY